MRAEMPGVVLHYHDTMIYSSGKPKLVLFLGAGFSRCVGIPTMDRFADGLRQSGFLGPEETKDFDHIQAVCNELAAVSGASARNLEQLCSFMSALQLLRPDFKFEGCSKAMQTPKAVLEKLTQCIAFMARPDLRGESVGSATDLLNAVSGYDVSCITTNYDLHVELAALRLGKSVFAARTNILPGGGRVPEQHNHAEPLYASTDQDRIRLFKLHGSVNWIESEGKVFAEESIQVDSRRRAAPDTLYGTPVEFALEGYPKWGDRNHTAINCRSQQRLIVPPTVIKPSLLDSGTSARASVLRDQWVGAADALSTADVIWFIGYSFPDTDTFMRFFLGASLFRNTRLRQVFVIDPNMSALRHRASPLFAAPQHREVFRGLPFPWEDLNRGGLVHGDIRLAVSESAWRLEELGLTINDLERGNLGG